MSAGSSSALPIILGTSLGERVDESLKQALVSVKYNFRPPSISAESAGLLHCPKKNQAEWLLEYAAERESESDADGSGKPQGFTGTQAAGKDVDCILCWDEDRQAYVLDRITSQFSLKYERNLGKLSAEAQRTLHALPPPPQLDGFRRSANTHESALGLDITERDLARSSLADAQEDTAMQDAQAMSKTGDDEEDDEDDFAKQLERDLEAFEDEDTNVQEEMMNDDHMSQPDHKPVATAATTAKTKTSKAKTGLGLSLAGDQHEDVMTPRGSPHIDRPTRAIGHAAATAQISALPNSVSVRSTPPGMSPASVANSPRPTGLESNLNISWRPPAQRSNVALAFGDLDEDDEDDDDDESEDDEDDEEESDEEDEEGTTSRSRDADNTANNNNDGDDDDDLDAFARELEGNLMEPATPIEEKPQARTTARSRRASGRNKS